MSTPSIVTIVNEIAHSLGHAGALSDEQLANVDSLFAWLGVFNENDEAATYAAEDAGHGWSAPQATWDVVEPLDDDPPGSDAITHTTQTGRLTIIAEQCPADELAPLFDWRLSFSFEAGPLPCTPHGVHHCYGSELCEESQHGRPVLDVVWTAKADRVTCTVEFLNAVLIAEKPSRVDLLARLARAAGLLDYVDERLRYAIATAEAHAVAIDTLREQSVACLERVARPRPTSTVGPRPAFNVPAGGLVFTPDDYAPATS